MKQETVNLLQEEFEDTKGVIKICILRKNRQHNGQKKKVQKDKQRSTKHTHNTKDRETRTPLKTGVNSQKMEGCETLEQVLIKNNYAQLPLTQRRICVHKQISQKNVTFCSKIYRSSFKRVRLKILTTSRQASG